MHPKASALLDAHVRHTLSRLEGEALDALLAESPTAHREAETAKAHRG